MKYQTADSNSLCRVQEKRTIRELGAVTPGFGATRGWEGRPNDTANLLGKALTLTNVCISFVPTGSGFRASITSRTAFGRPKSKMFVRVVRAE
jgi:hypothetical protein